jgi:hypothetical protein
MRKRPSTLEFDGEIKNPNRPNGMMSGLQTKRISHQHSPTLSVQYETILRPTQITRSILLPRLAVVNPLIGIGSM